MGKAGSTGAETPSETVGKKGKYLESKAEMCIRDRGKFLQNANFYLPVLQEYFPFFTFHSEGKLLYFIFSSFITPVSYTHLDVYKRQR